jgi:hypothetical protein
MAVVDVGCGVQAQAAMADRPGFAAACPLTDLFSIQPRPNHLTKRMLWISGPCSATGPGGGRIPAAGALAAQVVDLLAGLQGGLGPLALP